MQNKTFPPLLDFQFDTFFEGSLKQSRNIFHKPHGYVYSKMPCWSDRSDTKSRNVFKKPLVGSL